MGVRKVLHTPAALTQKKKIWFSLYRKLDVPHSLSRRYKKKKLWSLPRNELGIFGHSSRRLVAIPHEFECLERWRKLNSASWTTVRSHSPVHNLPLIIASPTKSSPVRSAAWSLNILEIRIGSLCSAPPLMLSPKPPSFCLVTLTIRSCNICNIYHRISLQSGKDISSRSLQLNYSWEMVGSLDRWGPRWHSG